MMMIVVIIIIIIIIIIITIAIAVYAVRFDYYQVDVTTVFAYPDISSEDGKALTSNCDFVSD